MMNQLAATFRRENDREITKSNIGWIAAVLVNVLALGIAYGRLTERIESMQERARIMETKVDRLVEAVIKK